MEIQYRSQLGELLAYLGLKGDVAEIGVAEGLHAEQLIKSNQIERLYLIDSWRELPQKGDGGFPQQWHDDNLKLAQQTLAPYEKAIWLRGLSRDMIDSIPNDSLVLAYLDGDHSYNGCLSDLQRIYKKVKVGGVIAGHDYLNPAYGVNQAVKFFVFESEGLYEMSDIHKTEEGGDDSMVSFWFIKKGEDADSI